MLDLIRVYADITTTRFYIYLNGECLSRTKPGDTARLTLVCEQRVKRDRLVSVLIDTAK